MAEQMLTRIIMFYVEASEAVKDYAKAKDKLELGLQRVNGNLFISTLQEKLMEIKLKIGS